MNEHRRPAPSQYDEDFYAWTLAQAKALRALKRRTVDAVNGLDIPHLAEEIEDLGKAELRGATRLIQNIFVHLIKAASYAGASALGHWRTETTTFHKEFGRYYTPGMRQRLDPNEIWDAARDIARDALHEHGAELGQVPAECPFSLAELLAKDFISTGPSQSSKVSAEAHTASSQRTHPAVRS